MVDFSAFEVKGAAAKNSLVAGLLGVAFLSIDIIFAFIVGPQRGMAYTLSAIYFYISLLACVGGLGTYLARQSWARKTTYIQFLIDNGWHATRETDLTNIATSLINTTDPPSVAHGFSGVYQGLEMHAVRYSYIAGTGREQRVSSFVNLSFVLGRQFPLMVLDDKQNNFLFDSNLPERIPGGRNLQVEGDFNSRFKLTVLPDTERDVLQLLTPDFMHELIKCGAAADIEIQANQLFIIARSAEFDEKTLRNLFGMTDVVLKNIAELSDTWQASSSPETVAAMADRALAPRLGLDFGPKKAGWFGVIVGVIAYLVLVLVTSLS